MFNGKVVTLNKIITTSNIFDVLNKVEQEEENNAKYRANASENHSTDAVIGEKI